jgi:DNA replication protein DnaC
VSAQEANKKRAQHLGLHGLADRWNDVATKDWVTELLGIEEEYRHRSGLARRLRGASLGDFKPLADFDWSWPEEIDRAAIEELMTLAFLDEKENVVLVGHNGTGKTLIAKNIGLEAVRRGRRVLFTDASEMLTQLSRAETTGGIGKALARLAKLDLLVIDEIGQVTFSARHADLLFAVINRRYLKKSTILTTNTPFAQWGDLFPSATCVHALVDRLMHRGEKVEIKGPSFRQRESEERQQRKLTRRTTRIRKPPEP